MNFIFSMGTTGKARRPGKADRVLMSLLVSWLLVACFVLDRAPADGQVGKSTRVSEVWVRFEVAGPGEGQEGGWPRIKDKLYEVMGR